MRPYTLRLFQTVPHGCGYFADRAARNVVLDPASATPGRDYAHALPLGFRRAGSHVYRPRCPSCQACVPSRIRVAAFRPDRSQRRCLQRNRDLHLRWSAPGATPERLALYRRYLQQRHPGSSMATDSAADFDSFLQAPWSNTSFLEGRHDGRLLVVAVTDVCPSGSSAVYTFFDPDEAARGLGVWAILQQLDMTRQKGLEHLYLGFWIAAHPRMAYKTRFDALELLGPDGWQMHQRTAAPHDRPDA